MFPVHNTSMPVLYILLCSDLYVLPSLCLSVLACFLHWLLTSDFISCYSSSVFIMLALVCRSLLSLLRGISFYQLGQDTTMPISATVHVKLTYIYMCT